MTTPRYLEVFAAVTAHLKEAGIDRVEYKPSPRSTTSILPRKTAMPCS